MSETTAATFLIDSTISLSDGAGLVDQIDAFPCTWAVRVGDQVLDVLCGLRRALGQAAHFGGDHREATAGFAGACRFHRRVERQQVGLARRSRRSRR